MSETINNPPIYDHKYGLMVSGDDVKFGRTGDLRAMMLQRRTLDVLWALLEHYGPLPWEALYKKVWGHVVVEDNQMSFQIRKLRAALREAADADACDVVKVEPRVGPYIDGALCWRLYSRA